jgi:integrase
MNNKNLKDSTKKQRLKKFLYIIRKATGDASLMYTGNLPRNTKAKLKHVISKEELINYTDYLKRNGLFESLLIVELLFKFGFRIGALSKLKTKNLTSDNILIVVEKNSEIVKKKLLKDTANKLRELIKIQKISNNDYIFFPGKFKNNEHKRSKFLSSYIKKSMINSKAFPDNGVENISAHCFRATLAVNKYREEGLFEAKKALNHKNISTTLSHYIKINERNIDLKEETKFQNNKEVNNIFNFYDKDKNYIDNNSYYEESESSEEFNFKTLNNNIEKKEQQLFLRVFHLKKIKYL